MWLALLESAVAKQLQHDEQAVKTGVALTTCLTPELCPRSPHKKGMLPRYSSPTTVPCIQSPPLGMVRPPSVRDPLHRVDTPSQKLRDAATTLC